MSTKIVQSSTSKAQTMADLLKSVKTPFKSLHKGDVIKGTITKMSPSEVLIDINAKSEAVLMEKDKQLLRYVLSILHVGDEVNVTVIYPESEMGFPLVSLRRYIEDIAWKKLEDSKKQKKEVEVNISEVTRGGFIVSVVESGISGFIPQSQISFSQNPQSMLGKKIKAFVLDLNREEKKAIFSQKPIIDAAEFSSLTNGIKVGQKISATVSNVTPFGPFVSLQNKEGKSIDGLIHISEIAWDKVSNIEDLFSVGQTVEAVVIGIDKEAKRVDLSIKRKTRDPFEEKIKNFAIDEKVSGKVKSVETFGVTVDLGDGIEGIIRKEKIPPTVKYEVGKDVKVTISQIDKEKHRIVLIPVLLEKPIGYR